MSRANKAAPFYRLTLNEQLHLAHEHAQHIISAAPWRHVIDADLEAVVREIAGSEPSPEHEQDAANLIYAGRAVGLLEGMFQVSGDFRQWRPARRAKRAPKGSRVR